MAKLALRSSYWIVDEENNIIFGNGRMQILESIERTGSINQAAKALKMSYKTAWSKIRSTETHLNAKIVSTDAGGTNLTPLGRRLMKLFRQLNAACRSADDELFDRIFKVP